MKQETSIHETLLDALKQAYPIVMKIAAKEDCTHLTDGTALLGPVALLGNQIRDAILRADGKIEYRDFEIRPSFASYDKSTDWTWVHKDYDPTPQHSYDPPSDNRCGYGRSVVDCQQQIDDWWEDA